MLTTGMLQTLWPAAPIAKILTIGRVCDDVLADAGINTPLRLAHFMAQISHENGGGTVVRENMNYRAARLLEIFGAGSGHKPPVTEAEAAALEHDPQAIAERVYGLGSPIKARELGNTQPGDGFRYRGGGDLQLTGRDSYTRLGAGFGLVDNPDKIADPETSFRVAAAEFVALGCLKWADKDDVVQVTRHVNGGTNGLPERRIWLRKWKQILPTFDEVRPSAEEPQNLPRAAEAQPETPPISQSKIVRAGTGIGALTIGDALASVNGVADQLKTTRDNAQSLGLVELMQHVVMNPRFLVAVGVLVLVGLVIYWRWRDHQ